MTAPNRAAAPDAAPTARARILRAAARLYARQGFAGTSMREIAAAAGVTKPLVHYYFGSKEHLFRSLLAEATDTCCRGTRDAVHCGSTAAERLRAVLAMQFARAREAPEVVAFAHEVMIQPGLLPLGVDYESQGRELLEAWVDLIEDGQRRGEFRVVDPRAVVWMAVATVSMYASAVLAGRIEAIPAGVEDTVFEVLLRGVEA